jgi:hypothetical protein
MLKKILEIEEWIVASLSLMERWRIESGSVAGGRASGLAVRW